MSDQFIPTCISYGATNIWRLNEKSGVIASDLIGGENGTYNGGYTLGLESPVNDPEGGSVLFDGSTGYMLTDSNVGDANFDYPDTHSIAFWIKTTDSAGTIFGQSTATTHKGWFIEVKFDGEFDVWLVDEFGISDFIRVSTSGVVINDGEWHFCVFTWSGGFDEAFLRLYVDGVHVIPDPEDETGLVTVGDSMVTAATQRLSIRARHNAIIRFLTCQVGDVVSFKNVVLSPGQILELNDIGRAIYQSQSRRGRFVPGAPRRVIR